METLSKVPGTLHEHRDKSAETEVREMHEKYHRDMTTRRVRKMQRCTIYSPHRIEEKQELSRIERASQVTPSFDSLGELLLDTRPRFLLQIP